MMVDTAKDMISTRSILPYSFLPFWYSRGEKLIKWYSFQGFVYEIYSSRDIRSTLDTAKEILYTFGTAQGTRNTLARAMIIAIHILPETQFFAMEEHT